MPSLTRIALTPLIWLLAAAVSLTGQLTGQQPLNLRTLVGATIRGTVTHVIDGDTIEIRTAQYRLIRIRFDGVDAPEFGKPFSRQATNFTRTMTYLKDVDVRGTDVDRYERLVARVVVDGKDVSLALVTAGLAWHYVCYSNDPALAGAERAAKTAKRGMWIDPSAKPPWTCTPRRG